MQKSLSPFLGMTRLHLDGFDRLVLAATVFSFVLVLTGLPGVPLKLSAAEWTGVVSGFVGLWLARIETPWTWAPAILNALAFGWIFLSIGAYANVAFQAVIFCLCLYGLAYWLRGGEGGKPAPISPAKASEWLWIVAGACGFVLLLTFLRTDLPRPIVALDALTTALGIAATWLQSRKRLEGWLVNGTMITLLVPLFLMAGSYGLALTAPAFVVTCISNHRVWAARMSAARRYGTP